MRVRLTSWSGVRVWLKWDRARKLAQVEPDEDDLAAATPDRLVAFWRAATRWAEAWTRAKPDWRVNGLVKAGDADEDDEATPLL
jgi:hypothetical protein